MHRFDYPLDETLIATTPMRQRTQSRLLIYNRDTRKILHQRFSSIIDFLKTHDLLVVNDTRVFQARLRATKEKTGNGTEGGGAVELLLLRPDPTGNPNTATPLCWEALVKGKGGASKVLTLQGGGQARLIDDMGEGRKKIALTLPDKEDIYSYLEKWGDVPLPPYIVRRRKTLMETAPDDARRYQTVYAKQTGSVAVPTAGLHFTRSLMAAIRKKGVSVASITLHIGTDTFRPIATETLFDHKMSGERVEIPEKTVYAFAETRKKGGRVFGVGTSVTRALESAADGKGGILPINRETDLFITPGYSFRCIDALITNLHPPRSTGLVLVTAFSDDNAVSVLYSEATEKRYRFFSYGDAMLIL